MATAEIAATEKLGKLCSKCGLMPAGKGDAWCPPCRNAYQRDRLDGTEWRAERRGILRGIQAMREHIGLHFRQWGGRPFMGNEVAGVVDSLPGPAVAEESAHRD